MTFGSATSRDGTRIGWTEMGRGEPLLLVHGSGADHRRWEAFAPLLADRFRLYLVDRRGRGLSGDGDDYAIEREFEDVAAVAEAIGGAAVFGHSYGGSVVLGAAARTDAITRVICYEGWPAAERAFDPGDAPERIEALLAGGDRDAAVTVLMRDLVGLTEDQLTRMRRQPLWGGRMAAAHTLPRELRAAPAADLSEAEVRAIRAPVLLLIGGQNEARLRAEAEALRSTLASARIVVLPGQGHVAMDAAPEMLAATLDAFVPAP